MAELRYQITDMLEQECKRRSCIEQASLQRIAELEAQVYMHKFYIWQIQISFFSFQMSEPFGFILFFLLFVFKVREEQRKYFIAIRRYHEAQKLAESRSAELHHLKNTLAVC